MKVNPFLMALPEPLVELLRPLAEIKGQTLTDFAVGLLYDYAGNQTSHLQIRIREAQLTEQLRQKVSATLSSQSADNPTMYAKLMGRVGSWCCYITEMDEKGGQAIVHGLFIGQIEAWQTIPLAQVIQIMGEQGVEIDVDKSFRPTPYKEVRQALKEAA